MAGSGATSHFHLRVLMAGSGATSPYHMRMLLACLRATSHFHMRELLAGSGATSHFLPECSSVAPRSFHSNFKPLPKIPLPPPPPQTHTQTKELFLVAYQTQDAWAGRVGACKHLERCPVSCLLSRSRIHEHTISRFRFLGIILRVLRLEVSEYNVYITNPVSTHRLLCNSLQRQQPTDYSAVGGKVLTIKTPTKR